MSRLVLRNLLLLFSVSLVAQAHDFFLFPSRFRVIPGDSVKIYIHVSDTFPGTAQNWNPERVARFVHIFNSTLSDLTAITPQDTPRCAALVLQERGTHLFALDWKARLIELRPNQFLHYLQSEGLDHIVELRKNRGENDTPGRERYSRYVKTVVQVGDSTSRSVDKVVGQRIEIIPFANPAQMSVGDSLKVRVLFEGKPLVGALISGSYEGFTNRPDTYQQSIRTDKDGRATFHLSHEGPWLIRVVHMIPLENSPEADWESFWASLTFEVRR